MLPNQTWVCLSTCSKANLLTLGCGEGKCSVYCMEPSKESRQLVLKRPELCDGFQRKVLKDRVREGDCGVCDKLWTFFWLVGGKVSGSQHHQPFGSNQSVVYVLWVAYG